MTPGFSYTITSLDDMAAEFDRRAALAKEAAEAAPTRLRREHLCGQAYAFAAAADMLRATTFKAPERQTLDELDRISGL